MADHSRPGPKETGVPLGFLSPLSVAAARSGDGRGGRDNEKAELGEGLWETWEGSLSEHSGTQPLSFLWGAIPSLGTLSPRRRPQAGERAVFWIPWLEEQISLLIDSCSPVSFSPLPSG